MNRKALVAIVGASALVVGAWAEAQQGGHEHQPTAPTGQAGQQGSGAGAGQPGPAMGPGMMMGPQGGMRHRGPGMGPGMMGASSPFERPLISEILGAKERLALTAEQEQKLRRLRTDFEKESIRRGAEIQVADVDLRELLAADAPDLAKVEAQVQKVAGMQGDLRFARIKVLQEGRAVLTADQWRKFEALPPRPGPAGMMGGMMQHQPGTAPGHGMMRGGMGQGGQQGHGTSPDQPGAPGGSQHGPAGSH